jgi:large subunit ribosomal protein L25
MERIILEIQLREETGRSQAKHLKDRGLVPAVVYKKGKETLAIKVARSDFLHLVHQHRPESVVIDLKIKDAKKEKDKTCLIKEIQYDPITDDIMHVDFNEISLTENIKINVPVVAKGEPIGVKQEGGSLEHILWEVEIECLPTDIPKEIEVDVSNLKIGDSIHIKDIAFPANIKVLTDLDAIVLSVASPMKEEVVVAPVEGEVTQEPEVIKEKKEVPEEEQVEGQEKEKEKEKEKK